MPREIKFRVFIEYKNLSCGFPDYTLMMNVNSINFVKGTLKAGNLNETYKIKDVKLLEYTGLKDKNGVKIFEGDIVKLDEEEICFIEWDEYDYSYRIKNKEVDDILAGFRPKDFEVIGNIYENKELLENE